MVKLTQEVLTKFALRADNQKVSLSLECKETNINLLGSETFLGEAIDNLIDNALLYGCPDGGFIDVGLKLGDGYAHLQIKDYGEGIKPELIENVFIRFFHGSESNKEGSGLGLSITKTIIELHDGELDITSDSQGTRLSIKLPLQLVLN